jgi:hypothetical protein
MQILPKILHIHMNELYSNSFINLPRKSCETVLSPLAAECAESSKNILLEREAQERKQEEEEEGTS